MKHFHFQRTTGLVPAALALGVLFNACLQEQPTNPGPPLQTEDSTSSITVNFATFYDTSAVHLTYPVLFEEYPGEEGAFIVGELGGNLYILRPDSAQPVTFFGHVPVALAAYNDGLLGLAFHPDFVNNRKYYAFYNPAPGQTLLTERTAKPGLAEDAGTQRDLLGLRTLNFPHNGGDIHFGQDGYLYAGLGDGASATEFLLAQDSLGANAQDLKVLYGKMIRIDVDGRDSGLEYAIPADNPFADTTDSLVRREIWAYGLRNPWRWNFDPLTGRIFEGEIGLVQREEINIIVKGGNYGWRLREGTTCFNDSDFWHPLSACNTAGLIDPIAQIYRAPPYTPSQAIIGGHVFRGDSTSPLYGAYLFGESVTGTIFLLPASEISGGRGAFTAVGQTHVHIGSFGTDSKGNIYVVGYAEGVIRRIDHPDLTGTLTP